MDTVKILTFTSEPEALLLEQILLDRGIPHMIRSYLDLAYDGLWQTNTVWGHLEAPEEYREEIMGIYNTLGNHDGIVEE